MITRKEKLGQNQRKHRKAKLLFGVLFLSLTIGSSIGVVFADQDIPTLLNNWFNKKGTESISVIEQAISTEKETQKERLKEELQKELKRSQKELEKFTDQEKKDRIKELREYTNQLIANLHIDNQKEEKSIKEQLKSIMNAAISEMEKVIPGNKAAGENDSIKNKEKESNGEVKENQPPDSENNDPNEDVTENNP
ncbi:hypothetical protein ACQKP0_02670 [Heyndrickxia sp. NPDC080065]|uniref:hypothetical protein n=1 Tax=Heyndrickxia sp. NPDC080065 TaxID=3390568 RepID=UPI003D0146A6